MGLAALGIRHWYSRGKILHAFLSSSVFIGASLCSAAFGLFPVVLPSTTDSALSLTVENTAAPLQGLVIGLYWFVPGILLAVAYTLFTHRKFSEKVTVRES